MNTLDTIDRPRLLAIARSLLGNRADAEDAVQDALLRALVQPATLETPQAWLTTVVRHLAIDRLRQQKLAHGVPADDAVAPSAEELADTALRSAQALRLLADTLSPTEASVLLLHEVFGFSHGSIATRAGKSEAACRQIAHRALQRLRTPAVPNDDRETSDAVFVLCRRALQTGSPAPLHALLVAPPTSASASSIALVTPAANGPRSTLIHVDGGYVLALVHEGQLLCSVPLGVVPACAWVA